MSKINETLVMMAEQKEQFEINGKKFQIIEVKEAEQPNVRVTMADPNAKLVEVVLEKIQPDYSHLVGKYFQYKDGDDLFTINKWYPAVRLDSDGELLFIDNMGMENGFLKGGAETCFDLSNPSDTNPDELKKTLVPNEIGIGLSDDSMCIYFGTNQSLLSRDTDNLPYRVLSKDYSKPIQCELIKCEQSELKKGDLAFMNWDEEVNFSRLSSYRVIISDEDYCYIEHNANIRTRLGDANTWNPGNPKHLYKVTPIE